MVFDKRVRLFLEEYKSVKHIHSDSPAQFEPEELIMYLKSAANELYDSLYDPCPDKSPEQNQEDAKMWAYKIQDYAEKLKKLI